MKLHVAYDQHGRILAAAEAGVKGAGDKPVAKLGMSVAELEVPHEFASTKLHEYVHRLHVDVGAKKLILKR
jgi:hypothetical protein